MKIARNYPNVSPSEVTLEVAKYVGPGGPTRLTSFYDGGGLRSSTHDPLWPAPFNPPTRWIGTYWPTELIKKFLSLKNNFNFLFYFLDGFWLANPPKIGHPLDLPLNWASCIFQPNFLNGPTRPPHLRRIESRAGQANPFCHPWPTLRRNKMQASSDLNPFHGLEESINKNT